MKPSTITKRDMARSLLDAGRPVEEVALACETTVAYVRLIKRWRDQESVTNVSQFYGEEGENTGIETETPVTP